MYPPHECTALWLRLATCLRGVVSQKLLRRADGAGRIVAQEILIGTPTVSKSLEQGRSADLYAAMRQDGQEGYWGMQTMNQCLLRHVDNNLIRESDAITHAGNVAELKQMLRKSAGERAAADATTAGRLAA